MLSCATDPSAFLGDTWEHSEQQGQAAGPTLQALSIEPSVVRIGIGIVTVTLTVTLTGPAPAGRLQLQLTASGNIGLAGALTVPSGATSGQNSREIDTNAVPFPITETVTATLGQASKTASFEIVR
jgi:hypothetical protein